MCKFIAVSSNDLAAYIVKNQPKKAAVTAAEINRNSIFHLLKGCNGKKATFSNRKRNTSHFSRLFLMLMLDENNNLCYTTIKEQFDRIK